LLALIKQNPAINTSALMAHTALDHRTVYRHLSALREQEKIIALGYVERHTMMWAIKPRGNKTGTNLAADWEQYDPTKSPSSVRSPRGH
jgi:hypothetical protein